MSRRPTTGAHAPILRLVRRRCRYQLLCLRRGMRHAPWRPGGGRFAVAAPHAGAEDAPGAPS
jgi:hypothetical protein